MSDIDVLVVGHGLAGSLSACLLSRTMCVAMTTGGTTATALSTGCLASGPETCDIAWIEHHLLPLLGYGGIGYVSGDHHGITEAGSVHRSQMAPRFVDVPHDASVSVLDTGTGIWDAKGAARGIAARGIAVDVIPSPIDRSPTWSMLTRQAEKMTDDIRGAMAEASGDVILVPPLFGLSDPERYMRSLEGCGRLVREAVVPLGLPGMRLQEALLRAASSRCTVLEGMRALVIRREGDSISAAVLQDGRRQRTITFSSLVLATGGLVGGGLEPKGMDLRESLGLFEVDGTGLQVQEGHPVFRDGAVCQNAVVAGALLPGMEYGDGGGLIDVANSVRRCLEALS